MKIIGFALLLFSVWTQAADAFHIHAVLVCDTDAENICYSVERNLDTVRAELRRAADHTDAELIEYIYTGENATPGFLKDLKKIPVEIDDVVVFYWSGHGCRTRKKANPWPNFLFHHHDQCVDQFFVTQKLAKKTPRLLLSISDTCNSYLWDHFCPKLAHKKRGLPLYSVEKTNYEALFASSSGIYLVSSSAPGEQSWYSRTNGGGYYTNALAASLQEGLKAEPPIDWPLIFDQAAANLANMHLPEQQTPQYKVFSYDFLEYVE